LGWSNGGRVAISIAAKYAHTKLVKNLMIVSSSISSKNVYYKLDKNGKESGDKCTTS
jgi:hypothetical protein